MIQAIVDVYPQKKQERATLNFLEEWHFTYSDRKKIWKLLETNENKISSLTLTQKRQIFTNNHLLKFSFQSVRITKPANMYLFKINNRNTRTKKAKNKNTRRRH